VKKEFEIYQDNKGNVYTITTELEELLLQDLVKLHSIIKEVREYIEKNTKEGPIQDKRYFYSPEQANDILGILDKVDKEENETI
jgi:hypothetical protein